MSICPACRAAEGNPLCGLAIEGCRECHVRRTAKLPREARQAVYEAIADAQERAAFVSDVSVFWRVWREAVDGAAAMKGGD